MRYTIGVVLALLVGGAIGFFGVLVSVFADSSSAEQLFAIGVLLLIYFALSAVLGFSLPAFSWKWGLLLGAPGVFFLGTYMLGEFRLLYLLYIALILCVACFGAWVGGLMRNRRKKEP